MRYGNKRLPSFLDFARLEHAQAIHEHTEQPTTQLGSVSFFDATSWPRKAKPYFELKADTTVKAVDYALEYIKLYSAGVSAKAAKGYLNSVEEEVI